MIGTLLGIVGIVLTLGLWYYDQQRRKPKEVVINIAMLGLGAAGKTRLVWQWSKAEVIRYSKPGATVARTIYGVKRAERLVKDRLVKTTYVIYDFGGQQPGQFLDEALSAYFQALILVLDHTASHESTVPIDQRRVDEQVGYAKGLVRGFLQAQKLSQYCKIVLIFINKADILRTEDRSRIQDVFSEIINVVRQSGKRTIVLLGSAEEGIKVMDGLAALDEALLV